MTNYVRWDPFTDLRQTMEDLLQHTFRPWHYSEPAGYQVSIPVDIWQSDDAVEINAVLPGVRPADVEITVENDVLTIRAPYAHPDESEQRNYHRREIAYGDFARSFMLPVSVDADKAEARFENGILCLRLPKAESARPKQIKIGANEQALLN